MNLPSHFARVFLITAFVDWTCWADTHSHENTLRKFASVAAHAYSPCRIHQVWWPLHFDNLFRIPPFRLILSAFSLFRSLLSSWLSNPYKNRGFKHGVSKQKNVEGSQKSCNFSAILRLLEVYPELGFFKIMLGIHWMYIHWINLLISELCRTKRSHSV